MLFVFINGEYQADQSNPEVLRDCFRAEPNTFDLNIPKGFNNQPIIRIQHITDKENTIQFRQAITVEENSEAAIVITHRGEDKIAYENHIETQLYLKQNAKLKYYKWQCEGNASMHADQLAAKQDSDSYLSTYHVMTGAAESNDYLEYVLSGEAAHCESFGFYRAGQKQQIKIQSRMHHQKSQTHSRQLYKGISDDQAAAAFFGKIIVEKNIKAIIAHQKNNNLLLSSKARADTKPELEIYSDDVQCTHGATVGQLDEKALFYLQSRGIAEQDAKRLLTDAFVNEILDMMPNVE